MHIVSHWYPYLVDLPHYDAVKREASQSVAAIGKVCTHAKQLFTAVEIVTLHVSRESYMHTEKDGKRNKK